MRHRALGSTEIEVSELGLGTWGLSGDGYGAVPETDQDRVIDRARAVGITLFETADSYAHGGMESRLARHLAGDDAAQVVTKLGTDRQANVPRKRFDAAYLREAFERSRERLDQARVSAVLLHNPSVTAVEQGEATTLLKELAAAGSVETWGVSAGNVAVARAAIRQGARIVELAYNAFFDSDLLELGSEIREHRVGVLARSVLSYGLLAGLWSPDKEFPAGDHRADRWTRDDLALRMRQLDAMRPAVGGNAPSLRAVALRFALSNELVSSAVIGPRSVPQLDQLVRERGTGPPYLAPEKLAALRTRLREAGASS
jgi:aryl-alcohol dehydrogenase-like predicted oxidoreductase